MQPGRVKFLKNKIGIVIFAFPQAMPKELLRREKRWLTDVCHNSWWHMKHAQHATYNLKFDKDRIIQTSPVVVVEKIKGPAHIVEGDHILKIFMVYIFCLLLYSMISNWQIFVNYVSTWNSVNAILFIRDWLKFDE